MPPYGDWQRRALSPGLTPKHPWKQGEGWPFTLPLLLSPSTHWHWWRFPGSFFAPHGIWGSPDRLPAQLRAFCPHMQKGMTEDEMVGWHHRLNGHEFEQAPGVGDWQGSLECCSLWSHKELDMTEQLNWTESIQVGIFFTFFLSFTSLLFIAISKVFSDNDFAFLHFFFLGMFLIPASCTMSQTSVHSSSGTISELLPWIYLSLPLYNRKGFDLDHLPSWSRVFPYFLQFKSEYGNKEFMIWATVSSWSCFCWLYRASPSLAAKNILNLI